MGFPTINDVEARLGFALYGDEAQQLAVFLEDFETYLNFLLKPRTIEEVDEKILKLIVGKHGKHFVQTAERAPGLVSYSTTSGDTSTSEGYSFDASDSFRLSAEERAMLGLRTADMFSIKLVPEGGSGRWIRNS